MLTNNASLLSFNDQQIVKKQFQWNFEITPEISAKSTSTNIHFYFSPRTQFFLFLEIWTPTFAEQAMFKRRIIVFENNFQKLGRDLNPFSPFAQAISFRYVPHPKFRREVNRTFVPTESLCSQSAGFSLLFFLASMTGLERRTSASTIIEFSYTFWTAPLRIAPWIHHWRWQPPLHMAHSPPPHFNKTDEWNFLTTALRYSTYRPKKPNWNGKQGRGK